MSSAKWDGDDFLRVVRRGMFSPTKGEVSDSDILSRYVQSAMVEFAGSHRVPDLEKYEDITTVADQGEYELSATDILYVREVEGVSDGTTPRLKPCTRENEIRYAGMSGNPFRYMMSSEGAAVTNTAVSLVPPPSTSGDTYRVWYTQIPEALTQSGSGEPATTTDFPESWDLAIALKAIVIGLTLSGRHKDAGVVRTDAMEAEYRAAKTLPGAAEKMWKPQTRMAAAVNR